MQYNQMLVSVHTSHSCQCMMCSRICPAAFATSYLLLFALGYVVRECLHDLKRHFRTFLWDGSWVDECWSENGDELFELLVQFLDHIQLLGVLLTKWYILSGVSLGHHL